MESKPRGEDAREQLAALDGAMKTVKRAAFPPSPIWYWFAIAFVGPAVVMFKTQSAVPGRFLPALVAGLFLLGVAFHSWRGMTVRPKRSLRTGAQLRASFAFTFAFIAGLQLTSALAERHDPLAVAVLSYLYFAAASAFLGRRAEAVVRTEAMLEP